MNDADKKLEYFCILSGGGVRGTSYIGVFRALEEIGVKVTGLAGASVGAIFAAFYTLGYTCDELEEIFLNTKYENFRDINLSLSKNFSIWKGDNILGWIQEIIEKKFYGENYEKDANQPVKFKDIDKDLIIITTDISTGSYKEFSRYETPNESIAAAIRASISLPGIFQPTWVDENCIIDGDIIRGLPYWSYSEHLNPKETRILEFRLEGQGKNSIDNNIEYITAIINTASNISTEFIMDKYLQNDKYDYIKINTRNTMPVDFSMKNERKQELIQLGYNTTMYYFKETLRLKKTKIAALYDEILEELKIIKELVKKQKDSKLELSLNKSVFSILKNKDLLEENLYNRCLELLEEISSNISVSHFFHKIIINNREKLTTKLENLIFFIANRQENLKKQLAIITQLLL